MESGAARAGGARVVLFCGDTTAGFAHPRKFAGIQRYAAARGWTAVAAPEASPDPAVMRRVLARHRPDGCILANSAARYDIPQALFGALPVVRINPPDAASARGCAGVVSSDNAAIVRLAFDELRASLPPAYAVIPSALLSSWSRLRARLFRAHARAAGKPCAEFDVRLGEPDDERAARMGRWLAALPRGTAVFAVTDRLATIAADAASAERLRVPHDLAILGVDDRDDLRRDGRVPISSIKIDFERLGFLAARLLAEALSARGDAEAQSGSDGDERQETRDGGGSNGDERRETRDGGGGDGDGRRETRDEGGDEGGSRLSSRVFRPTLRGSAALRETKKLRGSAALRETAGPPMSVVGPLMVVRRASTRGRGRRESWIPAAVDAIRREASDGLTAAALISRYRCSRNLFERRFREAMGHSVMDEIMHVRLENALALLSRPDFPIGAVADFSGFGSDSALRKVFLKRMGLSMRRWRAENVL